MKINFNTMKKEPITIEIEPIKHLIIQDIVNTENVYAIGYIDEEKRLIVQYKTKRNNKVLPEPFITVYENVPRKHINTIKHISTFNSELVDVFTYLKANIIKKHISWKLPALDVWK